MMKLWISALGFLAGLAVMPASAQQPPRLVVGNTSAPTSPSASTITYHIECGNLPFSLTLDYQSKRARWSTSVANDSDISATPLGQLLLARRMFGHLGFACWGKGVNVSFLGFEMRDSRTSEPVSYRGFLALDGRADVVSNVASMPLGILHQTWNDGQR
jgi:hypothetical protein